MRLYRVVVSFLREGLQFMTERGVLSASPGQAVDSMIAHLGIDPGTTYKLQILVFKPESLDDFGHDAQWLECLGSKYTVRDEWQKRF